MPKINGVEFHNKIKSRDKGAKVLFISGIEGADIIIDTMSNVKMEQLVKKPIERKRFIHAIESAIKGEIEIQ
jgi:DNA-binding NarL/FixJ family response regulator